MSSTVAAAASSTSSTTSTVPSSLPSIDLLRENRFYNRPPQEFLDDLANAAQDYIGEGCDALEKAIDQQVVKKPARRQEIGKAVDVLFQALDNTLQKELPQFESHVLSQSLRIPSHVVVSNELRAANSSFSGGLTRDAATEAKEQEQEKELEKELQQLQLRVASAAKLNRALRTQLQSYQQDAETYANYEDLFFTDKKKDAANEALVSSVQSVSASSAQLRPLHASLTAQFVQVFGEDNAAGLTAHATGNTGIAAAASSTAAGSGSMTQQINFAAANQPNENDTTAQAGTAAAANKGIADRIAVSEAAASSMF